jgi:hypothetical protein
MNHAAGKQAQTDGLAGGILRWWQQARLRQQHKGAERQLVIQETLALTPKQRILLLQCGSERFLVATGQDGAPSIVRLDAPSVWTGDED